VFDQGSGETSWRLAGDRLEVVASLAASERVGA
jgi:hypothetical protein